MSEVVAESTYVFFWLGLAINVLTSLYLILNCFSVNSPIELISPEVPQAVQAIAISLIAHTDSGCMHEFKM